MVYDLAIVGAGFWGGAVAAMAAEQGISTILLDNNNKQSGSRNAAGLFRENWFQESSRDKAFTKMAPEWWREESLWFSRRWLEFRGMKKVREDVRVLYGRMVDRQEECWMIPDVEKFLRDLISQTTVLRAEICLLRRRKSSWMLESVGVGWEARNVVIAAGVYTDELLENSKLSPVGVSPLAGRYLLYQSVEKLSRPLCVMTGPYQHYTFRPWVNGLVRLGDTIEKNGILNDKAIIDMGEVASRHLPPAIQTIKEHLGYRPVCKRAVVEKVVEGLVVATGGHRVGLGMAPAVARRSLKLLGLWGAEEEGS